MQIENYASVRFQNVELMPNQLVNELMSSCRLTKESIQELLKVRMTIQEISNLAALRNRANS